MKNIGLDLVKLCSVDTDISICSTHAGTENFSEISFYPSIYSHPPKWDNYSYFSCILACVCFFLNNHVASIRNFEIYMVLSLHSTTRCYLILAG